LRPSQLQVFLPFSYRKRDQFAPNHQQPFLPLLIRVESQVCSPITNTYFLPFSYVLRVKFAPQSETSIPPLLIQEGRPVCAQSPASISSPPNMCWESSLCPNQKQVFLPFSYRKRDQFAPNHQQAFLPFFIRVESQVFSPIRNKYSSSSHTGRETSLLPITNKYFLVGVESQVCAPIS
jgi:hypothetical protein